MSGLMCQASPWALPSPRRYFSDVFNEEYEPLSLVPMPLTAATITMLIPNAIRQYSMAVAPD